MTSDLHTGGPSTLDAPAPNRPRRAFVRVLAAVGGAGFVAFWVWALFFASKDPINAIGDDAWTARAEQICVAADAERLELADFREMREATPELVRERAEIVDRATDVLERMLDDIVAVEPATAKGRDLVPQWTAEYRSYLDSRRVFADTLRETGENGAFYEPEAGGIPVSERLEVFAADNGMATCAPPRDLTR